MIIRPRRSFLFMPGSNERALEKARSLPADGIIMDLEDSVSPEAKIVARDQIAVALQAGGFEKRELIVRINGLDTAWWIEDLAMVESVAPDGVLVPKVSNAADIRAVGDRLRTKGGDLRTNIWAMIETSMGVLHAEEIAQARVAEPRLAGLIVGPNDLARETRMRAHSGRSAMLPMLSHCVLAARAHGLSILDGVYNDFSNTSGFLSECLQGSDLGFDGKTLIHPSQIEIANQVFAPSAEDISFAHTIISIFAKPENANRGAVQINGSMVERLHLEVAHHTIALALASS
jgi:citrate lyase subunit beta/citryl-CoA lyase